MLCNQCKKDKKRIYFYLDSRNESGRKDICMKCHNKNKSRRNKLRVQRVIDDKRRVIEVGASAVVMYKRKAITGDALRVYNDNSTRVFMQYNHLIYKYIKDTYNLKFGEINTLLYLYPIQPFSRMTFLDCMHVLNFKCVGFFRRMINEGIIHVWRKKTSSQSIPDLYDMTDKGKSIIKDFHAFALGKKKIPEPNDYDLFASLSKLHSRKYKAPLL